MADPPPGFADPLPAPLTTRVAAGKGAVPYLLSVMGLMEQLGRQARTAAVDTYKVAAISPGVAASKRCCRSSISSSSICMPSWA